MWNQAGSSRAPPQSTEVNQPPVMPARTHASTASSLVHVPPTVPHAETAKAQAFDRRVSQYRKASAPGRQSADLLASPSSHVRTALLHLPPEATGAPEEMGELGACEEAAAAAVHGTRAPPSVLLAGLLVVAAGASPDSTAATAASSAGARRSPAAPEGQPVNSKRDAAIAAVRAAVAVARASSASAAGAAGKALGVGAGITDGGEEAARDAEAIEAAVDAAIAMSAVAAAAEADPSGEGRRLGVRGAGWTGRHSRSPIVDDLFQPADSRRPVRA
jgi:hypothetical protein